MLRAVASPEDVAAYRPVINRVADELNTETRPLAERDTYGKAFLQIQNLWERDEAARRGGATLRVGAALRHNRRRFDGRRRRADLPRKQRKLKEVIHDADDA